MNINYKELIKQICKKLDITQDELGTILGTHQSTISRYSKTSELPKDVIVKFYILQSILTDEYEYLLVKKILKHHFGYYLLNAILTIGYPSAKILYDNEYNSEKIVKLQKHHQEILEAIDTNQPLATILMLYDKKSTEDKAILNMLLCTRQIKEQNLNKISGILKSNTIKYLTDIVELNNKKTN